MTRISGELWIYLVVCAVITFIFIMEIINCYKIGKTGFVNSIKQQAINNISLKNELIKEKEYNRQQHKKLQEFMENIAHQIKTPLAVISLKLELIEELTQDNMVNQMLQECLVNTFKIKDFIK